MDAIKGILDFINGNWVSLSVIAVLAFGLARAIVKLTPTKTDDAIYDKVVAWTKTVLHVFGKDIDAKKSDEE